MWSCFFSHNLNCIDVGHLPRLVPQTVLALRGSYLSSKLLSLGVGKFLPSPLGSGSGSGSGLHHVLRYNQISRFA